MKKILLSISFFSLTFFSNAQSWVEQGPTFPAAQRGINEITIVDANTVWCLGYDGEPISASHPETLNIQEFTRTIDGGVTWISGTIDVGDFLIILTIFQLLVQLLLGFLRLIQRLLV